MSFKEQMRKKILILDGAMGTMIQKYSLGEDDYRNEELNGCTKGLKGNNECLNLTRPEIIRSIHNEYIAAGADIIETNTFSANRISQSEYGCEAMSRRMAYEGARIARQAADDAARKAAEIGLDRKVWVAGSMGPTSKSLSLSPDVADPAFRPYGFDDLKAAYKEQAQALLEGGVDLILLETCFDALNVKAALSAIAECAKDETIPVMVSVSVGDRSGRTLTGQTIEAFHTSIRHYSIVSFGLNCSLGASELMPLIEDMGRWCDSAISCYPNAGLPNEMGGYDQSPEEMAGQIKIMAQKGLVNIVGGCCGTTPDHIRAISKSVTGISPRQIPGPDKHNNLKVSGLEAVTIDLRNNNFTNVGERTNVAGSRKFARLIAEGKYDEALTIAARQIEDGAAIIDINMDDAMLDSAREMEKFVRYVSNDPSVAKAALMIDSSHWDTILAGLKNAQGKCIVNSISLKEGEDEFVRKARMISSYGAAMVVMAFDEEGQATTFERKISICERAYRLLTSKAGISPEDIIFDVNILSIGTGIEEHSRYAVDFIEAVRWIKASLPGALTSGGVSNLSFSFRGNNAVREAMHSAFLYHAIKAGLDMAIVNPSMLQVYDEIEHELLRCVEDVIFDSDPQATERLIVKAARLMEAATGQTGKEAGEDIGKAEINQPSLEERLRNALIKGRSESIEADLKEAMNTYGNALKIIEGPLMEGMETVGRMFGEGKMFLPQVVKSAKVMRDAVTILEPFMKEESTAKNNPKIVIATVKGDVHDIGKNITGIVLTCNGFDVHDLGVMVDKEAILSEAERIDADMIAVSGLITPSLYQMEELCREMAERQMDKPLLIGGATTSALHTAVRLAPIYGHVFHGADASAAAVMAKKYMMNPEGFEAEQHEEQERLRSMYEKAPATQEAGVRPAQTSFATESYVADLPHDIKAIELPAEEVMRYFDWRMFYAIWGVKYGSSSPEAMELLQLRQDAEDELEIGNFRIMLSARFLMGCSTGSEIRFEADGKSRSLPFMRQENGSMRSLCDFVTSEESGKKSPFGTFAISVRTKGKTHEEGCCCPACSNRYEDMIGKAVRMTLAEAASKWLDAHLAESVEGSGSKIIKPAAGYASCPDHTLKGDILELLGECGTPHEHTTHHAHGGHNEHHGCSCGHKHGPLGISLTESYAMTPEASICGLIFIHPDAEYPDIRRISRTQYDEYASARGFDNEKARRFFGHLLK